MNQYKLSKLSDKELVGAVIQGDESAINYFFYVKYTPLFNFNYHKVAANKNTTLEDLVQEFYLNLSKNDWAKLKTYNEKEGPLRNWLSVLSLRFFRDKTASMIDSAPHDPIDDMDYNRQFEDRANQTDRRLLLSDVMKLFDLLHPPRYKNVLMAVKVEGRSADEVAKELGVTKENLYNIVKRAKEQFDKLYELFFGEKYKD